MKNLIIYPLLLLSLFTGANAYYEEHLFEVSVKSSVDEHELAGGIMLPIEMAPSSLNDATGQITTLDGEVLDFYLDFFKKSVADIETDKEKSHKLRALSLLWVKAKVKKFNLEEGGNGEFILHKRIFADRKARKLNLELEYVNEMKSWVVRMNGAIVVNVEVDINKSVTTFESALAMIGGIPRVENMRIETLNCKNMKSFNNKKSGLPNEILKKCAGTKEHKELCSSINGRSLFISENLLSSCGISKEDHDEAILQFAKDSGWIIEQ
jgi:hypothetical protein